jgi:hypothetical protein
MSFRSAPLMFLLTLTTSVGAQDAVSTDVSRPLNLSLPRDAYWASPVRPDLAPSEPGQRGSAGLPDLGARGTTGQRSRMPYGTGYETRQRNSPSGESGGVTGRGSGQGSGRGMGRGR